MTNRILKTALAIGIASTFSLGASAAPGKMAALDLNGDTFVDQTEFLSAANEKFSTMDADGNGAVTKDERQAFRKLKREERAQRQFDRKDANNDGVISQQEDIDARAARDEKREAARAERRERKAERGEKRRSKEGRRGDRQRFNPDANGDGVVDVAEHGAAAQQAFARMDTNDDGVLSAEELKRKKRRGRRH
ncbi:MAG: hypothetical protein HKO02_10290 [Hyphomonadaceae bacterium]|nr:hypothetical protein [Hyphomonadaceae bacterium]